MLLDCHISISNYIKNYFSCFGPIVIKWLPVIVNQQQLQVDFRFQPSPFCLNLRKKCNLQKRKVLLFEKTMGYCVRTRYVSFICLCYLFFPFLFCFVPPTTCVCRKLAAGKQTPEGDRTRLLSQLKLPFWQVHRRQAGGQSKHSQIPQTNTGGKYKNLQAMGK